VKKDDEKGETVGRKSTNQNRKFLNGSAKPYGKREMYGRGATKMKHKREVKVGGIS
jgi:hypothetical protein